MNISMIGFGNMAQAIAQGLAQNETNSLQVAAPSLPIGFHQENIKTHPHNLAIISNADVIILAVKPAQMAGVLEEINPSLPENCFIISVAAGLNLDWFAKRLRVNMPVVRAMPNIAAAVGNAATPIVANKFVSNAQKQQAESIFSSVGLVNWLEHEDDINIYTALSGSGPAYVFLFMEALIKGAVTLGLTEDVAKTFALQTVKGALKMASASDLSLLELRKQVTSPAGTTAAAIDVLMNQKFEQSILSAMQAAYERAQTLGYDNH